MVTCGSGMCGTVARGSGMCVWNIVIMVACGSGMHGTLQLWLHVVVLCVIIVACGGYVHGSL